MGIDKSVTIHSHQMEDNGRINKSEILGSSKSNVLKYNSQRKSNKMQQRIKILFHIYIKLNMFRATHRPSSEA